MLVKELIKDLVQEDDLRSKVRQRLNVPAQQKTGSLVTGQDPMIAHLCDRLGLKNVHHLEINFSVNSIATVKAEFYLDSDQLREITTFTEEFTFHRR